MTVTDLPPSKRYSIRVTEPDGNTRRLGKMRVDTTPETVTVLTRTGEVAEEWSVVSVEHDRSRWTIVTTTGATLILASCGCGG